MWEELYGSHFKHVREVYDRALENHCYDKLICYSGDIRKRFLDDMPYPFIVNPQFKALVPLVDAPNSWVVWTKSSVPVLILYVPKDYWHLTPDFPDSYWTSYFTIEVISSKKQVMKYFGDTRNSVFLGEKNSVIEEGFSGQHNPQSLMNELNWYRSYKTSYEQECICNANRISVSGHNVVKNMFFDSRYVNELDVSLAFQKACRQNDDVLSYPSIVGINEHAAILHYFGRDSGNISMQSRRSLLIDAAASFAGYTADITRTYAFKDGLFSELVSAVDVMQQDLAGRFVVGLKYFDVGLEALILVASLLKEFNIISLDAESAVSSGVIGYFMPHGLSHFLGLQVHDVANNQAGLNGGELDTDPRFPKMAMMRSIETDHVVTVEPGIYFIDNLLKDLRESQYSNSINWELIENLRPNGGIRFEDNLLITGDGPINITRRQFGC